MSIDAPKDANRKVPTVMARTGKLGTDSARTTFNLSEDSHQALEWLVAKQGSPKEVLQEIINLVEGFDYYKEGRPKTDPKNSDEFLRILAESEQFAPASDQLIRKTYVIGEPALVLLNTMILKFITIAQLLNQFK